MICAPSYSELAYTSAANSKGSRWRIPEDCLLALPVGCANTLHCLDPNHASSPTSWNDCNDSSSSA
eukprot:6912023-Alexandrium_andersonii.AAC.1